MSDNVLDVVLLSLSCFLLYMGLKKRSVPSDAGSVEAIFLRYRKWGSILVGVGGLVGVLKHWLF